MTERIDAEVFAQFVPVFDEVGDVGELMAPEKAVNEAEREAFKNDRSYRPNLRVEDIDRVQLQSQLGKITELERVVATAKDPIIRKAYELQIAELRRGVDMVDAVVENNSARYDRLQTEIYGEFDTHFAEQVFSYLYEKAKEYEMSGSMSMREAARAVMDECRPLRDASFERTNLYPQDAQFELVRRQHIPYYARLLGGIAIPDVVTYEDRRIIIPQILGNIGVPAGMYEHVPRKKGITSWSISHVGTGEIRDPVERDMSPLRFKGLIAGHEVGTHVSERINAMEGPVGLLQFGLDSYLKAGEGKGVMREMVVYDTLEQYIDTPRDREILLRVALSAYPRLHPTTDFGSWFQFAEKLKTFWQLRDEPDLTLAEATGKVFDGTWNSVKRSWRGGLYRPDGTVMASRRDEVYAKGMIEQFTAASKMPGYVSYADRGKFDLLNRRHVEWMKAWGIVPEATKI